MGYGPLATLLLVLACNGSITGGEGLVDATAPAPDGSIAQPADGSVADAPAAHDALPDGAAADATGTSPHLVVLDVEYSHNTTTMAFSFFDLPSEFPADLTSPVDYAEGTFYERLEVTAKPSDRAVLYQLCFFQDNHSSDKHACVAQSGLSFTGTGVYEHSQDMTTIWQYDAIEWQRDLLDVMLVVKDGGGNPVDTRYGFENAWDGSPDLELYYPMAVRYTAVIVPPGEEFEGW